MLQVEGVVLLVHLNNVLKTLTRFRVFLKRSETYLGLKKKIKIVALTKMRRWSKDIWILQIFAPKTGWRTTLFSQMLWQYCHPISSESLSFTKVHIPSAELHSTTHHHLSLTTRVIGAPQMILQPIFSVFPCSPQPSGACWTPGLSIPWCCLPTSSSICLAFFPLSLCLARWFWPDLMNRKHDHTTAVCVSLRWSGGLHVVQLSAGSWHGLPCW